MDIKKITEIVNTGMLPEDVKRDLIITVIAHDENAIPDILKILNNERKTRETVLIDMNLELSRAHIYIEQRPESPKEAKDSLNKGFILDEISKFYLKYKGTVTHCFNRFN